MEVFEAGRIIGTIEAKTDSLFLEISCKITEKPEQLRRIYVQNGWKVEYLGIPDKKGVLKSRFPQKNLPDGILWGIACRQPKGEWVPWRGEVDGVPVEESFLKRGKAGFELAILPEQACEFPAYAEEIKIEAVLDREMGILPLTADGHLPMKETEIGGKTNEEMDRNNFDFELLADPSADDGSGEFTGDQEQGWQADRIDL